MDRRHAPVPVQRGEVVEARCVALGDGADGVVKFDDYVLFVPGVLRGEQVRIEVTSAARKHGRGRLLDVLEPSPHRVEPRCRHFLDCGGCHLQQLDPQHQRLAKAERVRSALAAELGREDVPVEPCLAADDPWQQRNKVAFHVQRAADGAWRAGHLAARSVRVVPIEECPVADPRAFGLAGSVAQLAAEHGIEPWDPDSDDGVLRAIVVRVAVSTGQLHVILVARRPARGQLRELARSVVAAGARGVSVSPNDGPFSRLLGTEVQRLAGERDLEDEVLGVRFRISPGAFFQTSHWGAATAAKVVRELLAAPADAVVHDLYAGVGLFGLTLARHVGRVVCVEENESAVRDAEITAERNGITNVTFKHGPVERVISYLARGQMPPYGVVLDPPRAGCRPFVLERLAHDVAPRRIAYVSCEPQTLARDAELLTRRGYRLVAVQPLDMFPHSHHVEAVALFEAVARLDPGRQRLYEKARRSLARRDARGG